MSRVRCRTAYISLLKRLQHHGIHEVLSWYPHLGYVPCAWPSVLEFQWFRVSLRTLLMHTYDHSRAFAGAVFLLHGLRVGCVGDLKGLQAAAQALYLACRSKNEHFWWIYRYYYSVYVSITRRVGLRSVDR